MLHHMLNIEEKGLVKNNNQCMAQDLKDYQVWLYISCCANKWL